MKCKNSETLRDGKIKKNAKRKIPKSDLVRESAGLVAEFASEHESYRTRLRSYGVRTQYASGLLKEKICCSVPEKQSTNNKSKIITVNESGHNKQSYPASPVAHQIVCPIITAERRNAFKKLSLNNTADRRDKETAKENLPDNTNTSVVVAAKKFAQAGAKPKQLKITTRSKAITKNNAKKIHFLEFESEQNSTILDLPEQRKTKILENHTSAGQDEQNNNSSVSNLNQSTTLVDTATIPAAHKKEKKFFHRSTNSKANKQKNDLNQKRSTIVRREKVYEFLSQSQTSDSDENAKKAATIRSNDPTADIVQRLIKEGKVRVATMRKGTGRPHLKHVAKSVTTKSQRNLKKNNKQKQTKLKQNIAGNEPNSAIAVQPKSNASLQLPIAMPADDCDNFDNCDDWQLAADDIEDEAIAQETAAAATIPSKATKPHTVQAAANNENDGTFSLLARSVLIRQANDRQNLEQKQKAKQLLEIAKKLISTPKHDKTLGIANLATTNLSPIVMTPPTRFSTAQPRSYSTLATPVTAAKASPWRVDNAEGLPKVFNFARSSGNLPSFSSDYIPQTPRKDKTKRNSTAITSFDSTTKQQNDGCAQTLPTNRRSLTSSFSSNDSNVENRPPAPPPPPTSTVSASPTTTANNDENSNIFNLKQLPNPRRTLKNRSPLKTINILEVVQLAPWKKNSDISKQTSPESKKTCQDIQTDLYGFESMLHDSSMQESNDNNVACPSDVFETPVKTQCNKKKNRVTDKVELFGFEDFLSQTLNSQQSQESDDEDAFNNTINRQSITLYEKMQELKKLKPTNNELSETIKDSSAAEISSQNSNLFLNGNQDQQMPYGLRQRNIKEMLCSTMVSHAKLPELDTRPSTSKEALKQFKLRQRNKSRLHLYNNDGTLADLFNDLEPETTFNEEDPHRTYVRPYKRKRRLRENQFTVFIESDASDDDFDGVDGSAESPRKKTKKQKKKKNLSTETTDTSGEVKPKKKRQRKQLKEDPGLREFVTTFNEMCKEVDQYELLVE